MPPRRSPLSEHALSALRSVPDALRPVPDALRALPDALRGVPSAVRGVPVAGIAIGAGLALVGSAVVVPGVLRVRRATPPTGVAPVAAVPRLPGGGDLFLVVAGGRTPRRIRGALPHATIHQLGPSEDADLVFREAVATRRYRALGLVTTTSSAVARSTTGHAAGEGLLAAAAGIAAWADLPLLVAPLGRPHPFIATAGVRSMRDALVALQRGTGIEVDLGSVSIDGGGAQTVIDSVSVGVPPEYAATRDQLARRIGRPAATLVALLRTLPHAAPIRLEVGGRPRRVLAVFAGVGSFGAGLVPRSRTSLADGSLDVRVLKAGMFDRGRAVRAVLGSILRPSAVHRAELREAVGLVDGTPRTVTLAVPAGVPHTEDGATTAPSHPYRMRISVRPHALRLYAPAERPLR